MVVLSRCWLAGVSAFPLAWNLLWACIWLTAGEGGYVPEHRQGSRKTLAMAG